MYNALYHFGSRWYSLHVALSAFIFLISWLPCFWTGHSKSIIYFAFCSNFMRLRSTIYMSVCNFVYRQLSCFQFDTSIHGATPGQWHETSGDYFTGPQGTDHTFLPGICISTESQPFCDHCSLHCRRTRRIHRGHRQPCIVLYIFVSPDIAVSHG